MTTINKKTIKEYSKKYDGWYRETAYEATENKIKVWLNTHRYLDKGRFVEIGRWKSPRTRRHYENNNPATVKEITKFSFATNNEEVMLKVLCSLNGVQYPVASAILHFAFPKKYPVMDFRAIWSLGWAQPKYYTFDFWQKYCLAIRDISKESGENIRTVDKALWQYSNEHQPKEIVSRGGGSDTTHSL